LVYVDAQQHRIPFGFAKAMQHLGERDTATSGSAGLEPCPAPWTGVASRVLTELPMHARPAGPAAGDRWARSRYAATVPTVLQPQCSCAILPRSIGNRVRRTPPESVATEDDAESCPLHSIPT
jgi:hypothetical protein